MSSGSTTRRGSNDVSWNFWRWPMSRRLMELSGVVSFHSYDTLPGLQAKLDISRCQDRPVLLA
jgi:hypothetical protein